MFREIKSLVVYRANLHPHGLPYAHNRLVLGETATPGSPWMCLVGFLHPFQISVDWQASLFGERWLRLSSWVWVIFGVGLFNKPHVCNHSQRAEGIRCFTEEIRESLLELGGVYSARCVTQLVALLLYLPDVLSQVCMFGCFIRIYFKILVKHFVFIWTLLDIGKLFL